VETGNKHHIEDEGLDLNLTLSYHLSIQISLDGFSFCILDSASNKFLLLQSFPLSDINDWQSLIKASEKIISENKIFEKKFKTTTVSLVSNKYTLIPTPLFDATRQKDYLQLNVDTDQSLIIRNDNLKSIDAKIIYGLPLSLDLMIRRNFPLCKMVHHLSGFIDTLLVQYQNSEKQVFVNAGETSFDIIITEGKKMVFCNTFTKNNSADLLYYLLYVLEQQKLSPQEVSVILCGSILKNSDLYQLLSNYIRNITFADKPENHQYSYKFEDLPKGSYLSLLSQLNH
jgi:phosphoribosyl-ATP pyrophosphohydrolase